MKNIKSLILTLSLTIAHTKLFAISSECVNPTLARKSLCDDIQRAQSAITNRDYAVAKALIQSLKEKIHAQDSLAQDIGNLEKSLSLSQQKQITQEPIEAAGGERIPLDKGRFRSDGWRKRTSSEIFSLYGVAVGHGIYSGFFGTTFKEDNSGPASFGLGGLLGLAGSIGAVALLDQGEGMRYGVPSGITSFYSSGMMTMLFTALFVDGMRRDQDSYDDKLQGYDYIRFIWYGGTGGAILGGALAHQAHLRPGQSIFISSAGNWAGLLGMGVVSSARDGRWLSTAVGGSSLGANIAGLALAGIAVHNDYAPSGSTVQMINLAGSAGVLTGGLLAMASSQKGSDNHRGICALLTGGGLLGLGLGYFFTRDWAPDTSALRSSTSASLGYPEKSPWTERIQFALAPASDGLAANMQFTW